MANMLELQKKCREARMVRDKELYEQQIMMGGQTDRWVYELYGLTEEEKVVKKREDGSGE
ncbi:hypothetical protein C5S35_03395 [Candidatus Methanophagaceae archaeon]|jgi:hypothetical protein|nr:hypothetical protein C5S35_03395 [Methanophagales archaeon]